MSLCCFSTVYARTTGPQASGELQSLSYPSLRDCRHMLLHPAFMLVRSSRICMASTFPTKPSPEPCATLYKSCSLCLVFYLGKEAIAKPDEERECVFLPLPVHGAF